MNNNTNKKVKTLVKRSQNVNQIFSELEDKYNYCNLKAYARRMLQPMLNQQQEFIRIKHNKVYGATPLQQNLPWSNIDDASEEPEKETVQELQKQDNKQRKEIKETNKHLSKLKNIMRKKKKMNYSLNEVIQREQMQNQNQPYIIKIDEEVSDEESKNKDQFEEYRGCSMKHTIKEVQQKITYYEQVSRKDLKILPQLQQENDLIRRITSSVLVQQELDKARSQNEHKIQQYLIEYEKEKQQQEKEDMSEQTSCQNNSRRSSFKSSGNFNRILPEIFKQNDNSKERDLHVIKDQLKNTSTFKKKLDLEAPSNQYFLPQIKDQRAPTNEQQMRSKKHKNSVAFSEIDENSMRSSSNQRIGEMRGDISSTGFSKHNDQTFHSNQQSEYGLDTTISHSQKLIYPNEDPYLFEQKEVKTPVKRVFNFDKMHKSFLLKRVISPIKFSNDDNKRSRDQSLKFLVHPQDQDGLSSVNNSKSLIKNYSMQNLQGGRNNNHSVLINTSQDHIIPQRIPNSYQLHSPNKLQKQNVSVINEHSRPKYENNHHQHHPQIHSNILSPTNHNLYHQKGNRINQQQGVHVPDFVIKMKNLILDVEAAGDNQLTEDQTTMLANILGLISMHKDTINYTGKSVVDYNFDMSKEHFVVPSKSRDNQMNMNNGNNRAPVYGSLALLDKIYSINLPDVYLSQGIGKEIDTLI